MRGMYEFMAERARLIRMGAMGHDRKTLALRHAKDVVKGHYIAKEQARADKSDPFVYKRVMSHIFGGVNLMSDYAVEFQTERQISWFDKETTVLVNRARNRKTPCL